jgi:hypothetical protein
VPDSVRERINVLCSEHTLKDLLRRAARAYSSPPTRNVPLKASVPRPGVPRPYPPSRPSRGRQPPGRDRVLSVRTCPRHFRSHHPTILS